MNRSPETDAELVEAIKRGDKKAFELLYKQYWPLIYQHSLTMLKDSTEAQDVVQELFIGLWEQREKLNITTSMTSYLYVAARNKVLNKIKRDSVIAKYMNELYLDKETLSLIPDNILIEKELAAQIERCVEHLPKRVREIFLLSREKGLTHQEIAELLNLSRSTVKKQISNALEQIRRRVKFLLLFY